MINRVLIRIKVIQIIYSFYKNEGKSLSAIEKELTYSLSKAHDLYNQLLFLMIEVTRLAQRKIENGKLKRNPTNEELNPNTKFADNLFIKQLSENKALLSHIEKNCSIWTEDKVLLKNILEQIESSEFYKEYMSSEGNDYESDKNLWKSIYKQCILNNEEIDKSLEENSLYWNDDKNIIDTFVMKTINRFSQEEKENQKLLPEYRTDDDREFAVKLIRKAIEEGQFCKELIDKHITNWEVDRIAFMDLLIMQTALAEILHFPNIPINVSIDEYIEISKWYSTPKSNSFINATLDSCVKTLAKENKIRKI